METTKFTYRVITNLTALTIAALIGFAASSSYADIDKSRLNAVLADLQSRIDQSKLSGAVVMVAQDGKVQMTEALGYQNVEDEVPMSTDSIFRIFSMTKPVAGTALMVLYDEGKFKLEDPVEKYMPELANMRVFVNQLDCSILRLSLKVQLLKLMPKQAS